LIPLRLTDLPLRLAEAGTGHESLIPAMTDDQKIAMSSPELSGPTRP